MMVAPRDNGPRFNQTYEWIGTKAWFAVDPLQNIEQLCYVPFVIKERETLPAARKRRHPDVPHSTARHYMA